MGGGGSQYLFGFGDLAERKHVLCVLTGAKHRVRSTRGARGSNPSQKTPRQRGAIAPSTRGARSLLFQSASLRLAQADSQHGKEFLFVCLCSPALFKRRASQRQTRALSTRKARSLLFKSARLCLAQY